MFTLKKIKTYSTTSQLADIATYIYINCHCTIDAQHTCNTTFINHNYIYI